jgi:ribonuclease HII
VARDVTISESLFAHDRGRGRYVCGADEVGMACWAGPLVAGAVRFDYARLDADVFERLEHLNSSKKVTPLRRAALLPVLFELADMVAYVAIPAGQIDREGPDVSNMLALSRALEAVAVPGSVNVVDGQQRKGVVLSAEWIVRGDETSAAIAAASIVAKEMRDDLMRRLDVAHPGYGFAVHKGYGTPEHEAALVKLGPCLPHRRSYLGKVYRRLGISPPADLEG